jgi:hypothetical protein
LTILALPSQFTILYQWGRLPFSRTPWDRPILHTESLGENPKPPPPLCPSHRDHWYHWYDLNLVSSASAFFFIN